MGWSELSMGGRVCVGRLEGHECVELALDFFFFADVQAVACEASAGEEDGFAVGAYVAASYVDVDVGLGSQIDGTEVACVVHALVAFVAAYEVECLVFG